MLDQSWETLISPNDHHLGTDNHLIYCKILLSWTEEGAGEPSTVLQNNRPLLITNFVYDSVRIGRLCRRVIKNALEIMIPGDGDTQVTRRRKKSKGKGQPHREPVFTVIHCTHEEFLF
jgi:hypothetical protein